MGGIHEDIERHDDDGKIGSERSFGIVFAVVFLIIALVPLFSGRAATRWALQAAAAFAICAFVAPDVLAPLNRAWYKLGLLLSAVVSPIAIFLVYVLAVVPTGLVMRLLGKDPMRMRFERDAPSYWVD